MLDPSAYRVERDLLGQQKIPAQAYYGIQTYRALENFQLSGVALSRYANFIRAIAMVKQACAQANFNFGLLSKEKMRGISRACLEIQQGQLHEHFKVDMLQGGAGTSTNIKRPSCGGFSIGRRPEAELKRLISSESVSVC
jgi:aspartate ammonia-lyase